MSINMSGRQKPVKKRKLKKSAFFLLFTVIIFLFLFVFPFFKIKEITVEGSARYGENQLIEITDIKKGDNAIILLLKNIKGIMSFRLTNIEDKFLRDYSYIEEIYVVYDPPSAIKLIVKDRKPVVKVVYKDSHLLVDKYGRILDVISSEEGEDFPSIIGMEIEGYKVGSDLNDTDPRRLKDAILTAEAIYNVDMDNDDFFSKKIEYIDITLPDMIRLNIENRIDVNLGDSRDITYKIAYLKEIDAKIDSTKKGYIDFTWAEYPTFIPLKEDDI